VGRGFARILGAVVGALALAGALVLLAGNLAGLLVLAAVALTAYALGRDLATLRAAAPEGRPVPAAHQPVLIMNPKSGDGKVERFHMEAEARRRGIEPVLLRPGDDLRELAERPKAEPLDLRFVGPDGEAQRGAHIVLISNNPYSLARLDGLGSRVRMDSGRLGVVVNVPGSASAAELLAFDAAGQVRRYPGWQEWDATAFTIDSGAQVAVGVDGEALSLDPPLEFAILPGALRCACPWVRPASHPPRWPWLRSARRRAWCAHGPRAGDQARRGRRAAPSLTALITGMFAARSGRQLQARSGDPLAEQLVRIDERLERIEAALRDRR
jgi:hypothetical protein